jgi:hypothetical protein
MIATTCPYRKPKTADRANRLIFASPCDVKFGVIMPWLGVVPMSRATKASISDQPLRTCCNNTMDVDRSLSRLQSELSKVARGDPAVRDVP